MEVLNSSHTILQTSLCVIQLPPCIYSYPVYLTGTTCTPDHCNGSTCYDLAAGGHQCICNEGWWGVGCNYSTHSDGLPRDRCRDPNLCNNHGRCVWDEKIPTYHSGCDCDPGWELSNNCKRPKGKKYCVEHEGTQNLFCSEHGICSHVFGKNAETGEYESIDYYCTCDGSEL